MKAKIIIKMNDKLKWFTLVELIVVITILAILGTIGFVQMNGFASSARDSRRVSDMSNITQTIELAVVTQGNAPIPTGAVSYTGGIVIIQMGTVTNATIPKMSGDFSDPVTKAPYNYSVFGNGSYYQLGMDFENPLSYDAGIGIPGIDTVYADTSTKYSKLSGSYQFDPSLPSLFFLTGTVNSASGGIFSPDVCFVMNNVSTNTFSSTSTGCIAKKNMNLKDMDSSLVGYWDMESLTASGLLKDLSGNGNDGTFSGGMVASTALTGGVVGKGMSFNEDSVTTNRIWLPSFGSWNYTNTLQSWYTLEAIVKRRSWLTSQWRIIGWFDAPLLMWDESNYTTIIHHDGIKYNSADKKNNYNTFIFITWTYDGNNLKLYINGKLVQTKNSVNKPSFLFSSSAVTIGSIVGWEPAYYFPWIIDDIKIYNHALSDDEIKQHAKIAGF